MMLYRATPHLVCLELPWGLRYDFFKFLSAWTYSTWTLSGALRFQQAGCPFKILASTSLGCGHVRFWRTGLKVVRPAL